MKRAAAMRVVVGGIMATALASAGRQQTNLSQD